MRSITAPFVVTPPAGARVQARLRPSQDDAAVLRIVGEYLGRLAGSDLARRCAMGVGTDGRAGRKRGADRSLVVAMVGGDYAHQQLPVAAGISEPPGCPQWPAQGHPRHPATAGGAGWWTLWQDPRVCHRPGAVGQAAAAAASPRTADPSRASDRRRPGVPASHRRMETAPMGAGAESYRPGRADIRVRAGHDPPATRPGGPLQEHKTGSGDRTPARAQVAQDRSVPPISADRR
jgi:hypothetical protein